jgi:hypothetical protein
MGGGSGGQASGFQHQKCLSRKPGRVKKGQWNAGGFSGPRRCDQDGVAFPCQGVGQCGQDVFYWKSVHARVHHG